MASILRVKEYPYRAVFHVVCVHVYKAKVHRSQEQNILGSNDAAAL